MGLEVFWRESAPVEGHIFAGGCYGGKGGFAVMRAPSPLSFLFEVEQQKEGGVINRAAKRRGRAAREARRAARVSALTVPSGLQNSQKFPECVSLGGMRTGRARAKWALDLRAFPWPRRRGLLRLRKLEYLLRFYCFTW